MKDGDRGSVTVWLLGLAVVLLLFGGLAVDFWRALALQRELAAIADSAAVAGASGIDESHYRSSGELRLLPERSRSLAEASISSQARPLTASSIAFDGPTRITVTVEDEVELGLLGVFVDQSEPLLVRASAVATPVEVP